MSDMRETGVVGGIGRFTDGRAGADGSIPEPTAKAAPAVPAKVDDLDRELDLEMAEKAATLRKAGFTDEEVARHVGQAPAAVSTASTQARLAEIRALKSTAPKRYWANETQAEELALIEALQGAKAGKAAPAATEHADDPAALARKLSSIWGLRTSDPAKYASDATAKEATALLETLQASADGRAALAAARSARRPAPAASEAKPTAAETRLTEIDEELAALQDQRRNAKGAERDRIDEKERTLIAEAEVVEVGALLGDDVVGDMVPYLSAHGGVQAGVKALAGLVKGSGAGAETWADFDGLPAAARTTIMQVALAGNGSLSGIEKAIERQLSGSDLAAYRAWVGKHGDQIRAGLRR
jgi:hypothetical protein